MKKILFGLVAILSVFTSCQKEAIPESNAGEEIVFKVGGEGLNLNVDTRTTAVTSVSTVWWECKSGTNVVYSPASYSVQSGTVRTSKYWPVATTTYNYVVANRTFGSSADTVKDASNTMDIVVGTATASSNSVTVTLNHIFARTGTLTLTPTDGYSLTTGVSPVWTIKSKGANTGTVGTYTIGAGTWASTTQLSTAATITSSSDLYLIPGAYTVSVTYSLTKGGYTKSFTKTADVTLVAGKVNNISGSVAGDAIEITFSVSVTAWGTNSITIFN